MSEVNFRQGTPIYLYMAPSALDAEAIEKIFVNSIVADVIADNGGLLLAIETRYYGESQPTEDLSLENLQYLHIDNIFMDYNRILIDDFLTNYPFSVDVIAVGEGIGASYATFFRSTYQSLGIRASVVTGAALDVRTDFSEFFTDIDASFMNHADYECLDTISYGLNDLLNQFLFQDSAEVERIFNLEAGSFNASSHKDITLLFEDFVGNYIASFPARNDVNAIREFCDALENAQGSDLERLASGFTPSRHFSYEAFVNNLRVETIGHTTHRPYISLSSRPSLYQQCSQLNWFRTTTGLSHPSDVLVPIDFYYELCADVFGSSFTPEFIRTQHELYIGFHGGSNPSNTGNSIFVYGGMDPYRLIGVSSVPASSHVYTLANYGDTQALRSVSSNDSNDVTFLKLAIRLHFLTLYQDVKN